jgi:hypothetical protein
MALTKPALYTPIPTTLLIPGRWIYGTVVDVLCDNYNRLLGEYLPGDIYCSAQSGYDTGAAQAYETVGSFINNMTVATLYSFIWRQCKDFTQFTVDLDAEAVDNDVDCRAVSTTAGGGTGSWITYTAGTRATQNLGSVTIGTATDPIVTIDGRASAVATTPYLKIFGIRIRYVPLSSPLTAGVMAGSGAYPIDIAYAAEGKPLSTYLARELSLGTQAVFEHRGQIWSAVHALDNRLQETPWTELTGVWTPLIHLPLGTLQSDTLRVWLLGNATVVGHNVVVSCASTKLSQYGDLTGSHPCTASEWESSLTFTIVPGKDQSLRFSIRSCYLYGIIVQEEWA